MKGDRVEFVDANKFTRVVGSLKYFTSTRLDIIFGVGLISSFIEFARQSHWQREF